MKVHDISLPMELAALLVALAASSLFSMARGEELRLFREDFDGLSSWKEVFFPKIPRHTIYGIEKAGSESYLVARSDASASLLVYRKPFDVYKNPRVRWRWKVSNLYRKADPRTKEGDDYPLRIYVAFQYDPSRAGVIEKAVYNAARLVYGEYPPLRSLNYVWASGPDPQRMIPSAYTDRSMMIPLESGGARAGQWVVEEVDVLSDYRKAFGGDPPHMATIGIMNDSDNTGERSTSYVDFIEVFR